VKIIHVRTIRAAARCDAAERWDVIPRVVRGGSTEPRPAPCWACQGRTRHRQNCVLDGTFLTLPEGPGPEKSSA